MQQKSMFITAAPIGASPKLINASGAFYVPYEFVASKDAKGLCENGWKTIDSQGLGVFPNGVIPMKIFNAIQDKSLAQKLLLN